MGLLLIVVLTSGCASNRKAQIPTGPHLKIATWNVNFGGSQKKRAAQIIRKMDADIVCLQETNARWQSSLVAELKDLYPHMLFHNSRAAGGQAVLSKIPIVEKDWFVAGKGWFPVWILEAETTIGTLQIGSVHLRPPVSDTGSWVKGYFTTDSIRKGEITALKARMNSKLPSIIVGDFNESDSGDAVRYLEGQGMHNALPQFDRKGKTWRWYLGPIKLSNRLDHILYDSRLDVSACGVVRAGGSDHFPILAWVIPATKKLVPKNHSGSSLSIGVNY